MPPEATPSTGNASIDAVVEDIRSTIQKFDEPIAKLREQGGTHDQQIAKLEADRDRLVEEMRTVGERIATIDVDVGTTPEENRSFDFGKVAQSLYIAHSGRGANSTDKVWKNAPFEREVIEAAYGVARSQLESFRSLAGVGTGDNQRALSTLDDELGGVLIPNGPAKEYLDLLRNKLVLRKLGARFVTGLVGNRVPWTTGLSQGATASWLGESEEPTASDQKFEVKYMTPKRLAAFTAVANNLLRWSPGTTRQIIEEDLTSACAHEWESKAIVGIGSEHSPKGVINFDGVTAQANGSDANTGARFQQKHIAQLRRILKANKIPLDPASAGLLISPLVEELLLTEGVEMFSGQGADSGMPAYNVGFSEAKLRELMGRYECSTVVPDDVTKGSGTDMSYAIYGVWSELVLGQWGGIVLKASSETGNASLGSAFLKDQTWIVAEMEVDALVRRPEAFAYVSDVLTSV